MGVKLIVGLQNPGQTYAATRHNAGAWFVEAFIAAHHLSYKVHAALKTALTSFEIEGQRCYFALPTTFMNHSGEAVRAIAQFYRILPNEILVVHDDLDLAAGRLQFKTGGGHGGHNGLRDIITQLGSAAFHRLRIGIGHPGHASFVVDYVLGKPSAADREAICAAIDRGITAVPLMIEGAFSHLMTTINREK